MNQDEIRSQEWIDRIEALVHRAETLPDANAREVVVDLLRAVLDFHGAALERMLEIGSAPADNGFPFLERLATDDLTSSLLLLHGLHPDDMETRIARATRKLQDSFGASATVSLLGIESGLVRVRFDSNRAWPAPDVRARIENTILQAAPEIESIAIEGLKETPVDGFVPVSELLASSPL